MKQTIGIYSGTFDPIHTGHVAFAAEGTARVSAGSSCIYARTKPRNKNQVTDISHRIALIKAAIADDQDFLFLEPTSDQFSVDTTLSNLHTVFPDGKLALLIGSDVLKGSFANWQGIELLLRDVSLAIGLRDGDTADEIAVIVSGLETIHRLTIDYQTIQATDGHVASSKLRNNSNDTPHLHSRVSDYIREHGLYKVLNND